MKKARGFVNPPCPTYLTRTIENPMAQANDKDRAQRLADALRENLRRRKAQAREAGGGTAAVNSSEAEPSTPPRSPS